MFWAFVVFLETSNLGKQLKLCFLFVLFLLWKLVKHKEKLTWN